MFTITLSEMLDAGKVTVNSLHPATFMNTPMVRWPLRRCRRLKVTAYPVSRRRMKEDSFSRVGLTSVPFG
jgi:hypothetical protein